MKLRKGNKAMADLATRFVNLETKDAVRQFVREHAGDIRCSEKDAGVLWHTRQHLRSAWPGETTYDGLLDAEKVLQGILFRVRAAQFGNAVVAVDYGTPEQEDIWARPAVELVPYKKSKKGVNFFFRFKRRDVLDDIAYAILVALRRGLLRKCKGSVEHKDWNCRAPFLVADEGRRKYCYGACGENNQIELARKWHRTHPKKRRKLAA